MCLDSDWETVPLWRVLSYLGQPGTSSRKVMHVCTAARAATSSHWPQQEVTSFSQASRVSCRGGGVQTSTTDVSGPINTDTPRHRVNAYQQYEHKTAQQIPSNRGRWKAGKLGCLQKK